MFAIDHREFNPVLEKLHALCIARKARLATAESCTGGLISALLTKTSGSSAYVLGGVCSYSNEAKSMLLQVPESLIRDHGAVSEPVARAMAEGARSVFGADFSVSVTGVAGPTGGSPEKPVGTVFVGFSRDGATDVERLQLTGDRDAIRAQTCLFALAGLYERLLSSKGVFP